MEDKKRLGAFYTEDAVAAFLVQWGLSKSTGSVMDPSCGDGRFLVQAARLGATRVVGCDADSSAVKATRENLASEECEAEVVESDFFRQEPTSLGSVDLVVGNPPFIRYQRFNGESRELAQASARRLGVHLNGLAASWAPFLIHSLRFLRPEGAMAMVVPAEIVQTTYGLPVLRGLLAHFERVRLIAFDRNIFDEAQEETFLLLAERCGRHTSEIEIVHLTNSSELDGLTDQRMEQLVTTAQVPAEGPFSFGYTLLTDSVRAEWDEFIGRGPVTPLERIATVTNGYVSGANAFFHRTTEEALAVGIPAEWLRVSAKGSRSLIGLSFTETDVGLLESKGEAHHLVVPQENDADALTRFTSEGESSGIDARFKCRTRSPWWKVPGLHVPHAFFPYMIASTPHASLNECGAVYTNTLHGIRFVDGIDPRLAVLALLTTPALLSMELVGRSYGGGVLKLEPSELRRVTVPLPDVPEASVARAFAQADSLVRSGRYQAAVESADALLLEETGICETKTLLALQGARDYLVSRRMTRARRANHERTGSEDLAGCS
jgi:methylase of polypeptide subunit release factors